MPGPKRRRSSLAESLTSLLDPTPQATDIDPEDNDWRDGENGESSDDNDNDDNDELQDLEEVENQVDPRVRLRPDPSLTTGKYAGKRASRGDIFEDEMIEKSDLNEDFASSSDDDEDDEDDSSEEGSLHEGKEEEESASEEEVSSGEGDSDDDDDDDDDDPDEAELSAVLAQVNGNSSVDESKGKKRNENGKTSEPALTSAGGDSVGSGAPRRGDKAGAVAAQRALWDAALETRIRLQPLLSGAVRLPLPDVLGEIPKKSKEGKALKAALHEFGEAARETLGMLWDARVGLIKQHAAFGPRVEEGSRGTKRSWADVDSRTAFAPEKESGEMWEAMGGLNEAMRGVEGAVLDHWARKTSLANPAMTAKKWGTGSTSLSASVAETLEDRERLVKRSRTVRGGASDGRFGGSVSLGDVDVEVFDDGDFYQTLLRALIDSGAASAQESAGTDAQLMADVSRRIAAYQAAKDAVSRSRKGSGKKVSGSGRVVDPKASKGRKLRYTVHEKLVNYMAPIGGGRVAVSGDSGHHDMDVEDTSRTALLASLFA